MKTSIPLLAEIATIATSTTTSDLAAAVVACCLPAFSLTPVAIVAPMSVVGSDDDDGSICTIPGS